MTTALALIIWLAITVLTPAKVRFFFSSISFVVAFVFVAWTWSDDTHEEPVAVPSYDNKEAFTLEAKQFKELAKPQEKIELITIPKIEDLKKLNKSLYTYKDLSAEQLKALEGQADYHEFTKGKLGIIVRKVKAGLDKNNVFQPSYEGIEFTKLPFIDVNQELIKKQSIIDEIRDVVSPQDSAGNI